MVIDDTRLVLFRPARPGDDGEQYGLAQVLKKVIFVLQPRRPTLSSFGRASSLSLGSIAFGSLIVTLLDILRLLLDMIRNNANADGSCEW